MPIPYLILRSSQPSESGHYPVDSFRDLAQLEPAGVYTIARTYQRRQCIRLDAHLDRLEESAHLSGSILHLDRPVLRKGLRQLLDTSAFSESRFRITIPFEDLSTIILAAEPLNTVPETLRQHGVAVATCQGVRSIPRAKRNEWLHLRQSIREGLPADCYEGIIRDSEGQLLEGLSSNFYGVYRGRLHTAEEGVLQGITRSIVLDLAEATIPVIRRPVLAKWLPDLEEAFLTSSSREVLSIVRIDGHDVGSGTPGKHTLRLASLYRTWVEENSNPI